MTTALEQAIRGAHRVTVAEREAAVDELSLVAMQKQEGAKLLEGLLGIEEHLRPEIQRNLDSLGLREAELEAKSKLDTRYPLLGMEPLTWRDENGWPRLAVFSLKSPHFVISVKGEIVSGGQMKLVSEIAPDLPKPIEDCYMDVVKILQKRVVNGRKSLKLTTTFGGIIPGHVKEKIAEACATFQDVFIIAEPTRGFVLNEEAIVEPKKDPLVVGFDGTNLWLVVAFDTTPVEEAMCFTPAPKN